MSNFHVNSILITGAGRGIGLELVRQISSLPQPPKHILVTCRKPETATELQEIAARIPNVQIFKFDVVDFAAYPRLVEWAESKLDGEGLNILWNNAAVKCETDSLETITSDIMINELTTNTVAPLMLAKAFLPLLKKAAATSKLSGMSVSKAAILNMSTMMASISENTGGGIYPYRASKTALNMITKSLSVDLKEQGILCVVLHPGWVLTDMGGPDALVDTKTSVSGLLQVVPTLQDKDSGTFVKFNGDRLPW